MKDIPNGSVDMILCDLPYGTTACKWDTIIPFEPLWEQYKRIIKDNGAIVLFGSEPFSSKLRMSNMNMYGYDWIWEKDQGSNFFMANKQPLKNYETVSVFYKHQVSYTPQMIPVDKTWVKNDTGNNIIQHLNVAEKKQNRMSKGCVRYPKAIIKFNRIRDGLHPTQKPVALLEYLIRTYTNEGDMVLDNCMGSGSTCVAAINTNRHYIGIEKEHRYFDIAQERIRQTKGQLTLSSISPEVTG